MTTSAYDLEPDASRSRPRRLWPAVLVFYLIASLAAGVLGALQPSIGIDPELVQLTQLGPAIGVVVVLALWRPKPTKSTGLRLAAGLGRWRFVTSRAVLALLAAAAVFALIALVYSVGGADLQLRTPASLGPPLAALLVAQVLGAAAEELGWRCLLQPSLQTRLSTLASSVLVGVLWGFWHVPTVTQGLVIGSAFMIAAIAMSVTIGELLRASGGHNLVIATVFHTAVNIGMLGMLDEEDGDPAAMVAFAAGTVVVAVGAVLVGYLMGRSSQDGRVDHRVGVDAEH